MCSKFDLMLWINTVPFSNAGILVAVKGETCHLTEDRNVQHVNIKKCYHIIF
jgi:hypothetical protein